MAVVTLDLLQDGGHTHQSSSFKVRACYYAFRKYAEMVLSSGGASSSQAHHVLIQTKVHTKQNSVL
jgi:hypothetical protein